MCKKLLIFSATFGLGICFLQVFNHYEQQHQLPAIEFQNKSVDISSQTTQKLNPIVEFFNDFKKAVAENNHEIVASSVKFPLKVNFNDNNRKSSNKIIKNKAEFLANYDRIFDDSLKKSISQTNSEMFLVSTGGDVFNVKSGILMKTFGISEMPRNHQLTNDDIKITVLKRN